MIWRLPAQFCLWFCSESELSFVAMPAIEVHQSSPQRKNFSMMCHRYFRRGVSIRSPNLIFASVKRNFSAPAACALNFTADRYENVKRGLFASVCDADIRFFTSILGANGVLSSSAVDLEAYNVDWMRSFKGVLTAEAGCVLQTLHDYVNERNYIMPLDLGAKGSCQIGGNIATAAGGVRFIRYGSLHSHLLGLEVVLADSAGTVLDCLGNVAKDNTGLHHLFVGSEGQLGIITQAVLTCPVRPSSVGVAFLACESFQDCLHVLQAARKDLGEILSSFEFIDAPALQCVQEKLRLRHPLNQLYPFYLLVEVSGSNKQHDDEKLDQFLQSAMASGRITDGVVAADTTQAQNIWALREHITEALQKDGYVFKQDISLPVREYYSVVEEIRRRVADIATRVVAYGHLGDGNCHLNITAPAFSMELYNRLYPFLYEWIKERRGSISAEHGVGFIKRHYIHYSKSKEAIQLMRKLKDTFDPRGILNPYKTIPSLDSPL